MAEERLTFQVREAVTTIVEPPGDKKKEPQTETPAPATKGVKDGDSQEKKPGSGQD